MGISTKGGEVKRRGPDSFIMQRTRKSSGHFAKWVEAGAVVREAAAEFMV